MSTLVSFEQAVAALGQGEVVGLPTDTVYGLAGSLAHPDAVARLFTIKQRPSTVALPVLAASRDSIAALGVAWGEPARRLSEVFWPGALTIVVPVPRSLAELVGSTNGAVGFRVPHVEQLRELLIASGPLAVSSANEHGQPPCQRALDVVNTFAGTALAGVLDGGERSATVSTVVQIDGSGLTVLRQGSITLDELEAALV